MTTQEKLIDLRTRLERRLQLNVQEEDSPGVMSRLMARGRLYAYQDALDLLNEYFPHLDLPAVPPAITKP